MAQFLRPTSDVSVGTWTTSPLWSKLDETAADDGDFVQSVAAPSSAAFEVALNTGTQPKDGTRTIRVRHRKSITSARNMDLQLALMRGGSTVRSVNATNISTTFTTTSFTLISDPAGWDDLRVRVTATQAAPITVAPTYQAAGTASFTATNGADLTPALPAGWAENDILLLLVARSDNTAITTPSGWTKLTPSGAAETNTSAQIVSVYWKRATSGETAPTVTAGTGTVVRGARIFAIRGCPTGSDPFVGSSRSNNAASATVSTVSMTPSENDTLNIFLVAYEDDPNSYAQPSGWSLFTAGSSTLGNDMGLAVSSLTQTTAAALNPSTTVSGGPFADSPNVGILLSLKGTPAPDATTEVSWIEMETPDPVVTHQGVLPTSAAGNLSSTGTRVHSATLTVSAVGNLTANGDEIAAAVAKVQVAWAHFTAEKTAGVIEQGTLSLSSVGSSTLLGQSIRSALVALEATGYLTAAGVVPRAVVVAQSVRSSLIIQNQTNDAVYIGGSSVTVDNGLRLEPYAILYDVEFVGDIYAISATGSSVDVRYLETDEVGDVTHQGAVTYNASGTSVLSGQQTKALSTAFTAASDYTIAGLRQKFGVLPFTSTSTATFTRQYLAGASVPLSSVGTFSAVSLRIASAVFSLAGDGTLTTVGQRVQRGVLPFTATSNSTLLAHLFVASTLSINSTSNGTWNAVAIRQSLFGTTAASDTTFAATRLRQATLALAAEGRLVAAGIVPPAVVVTAGIRASVMIQNLTNEGVYLGGSDVTATNGLYLAPNAVLDDVEFVGNIYAVSASNDSVDVRYLETSEGGVQSGAVSYSAVGNLVALGKVNLVGALSASATGTWLATGQRTQRGTLLLDGLGDLVLVASKLVEGVVAYSGQGDITLQSSTTTTHQGTMLLDSHGDLLLVPTRTLSTEFTNYADGSFVAIAAQTFASSLGFDGTSLLIANATRNLVGQFALTARGLVVFITQRPLLAPPGLFRIEQAIPIAFVGAELETVVALLRNERLVPAALLAHTEQIVPVALLTDEHSMAVATVSGEYVVPVLVTREEIETALALIREESSQIGIP